MKITRQYSFDKIQKIWVTSTHEGSSYSDGDAVENRLLSVLKNCVDISVSSEELHFHITDWPSEYHLSPARQNLLRPFPFESTDKILELGCGCGAITRHLGETGATVVAVEGSRRRAAIAAERCRDLPNVTVYCDNLIDFQMNEAFDFVTLIGVLEYSQQFIDEPDPVHACLEKASQYLANDGTLIIAIENQLGLKYFNGCNEDHVGIPYYGINGLYNERDPQTFGRYVLEKMLGDAGFKFQEFLFPFPDYKLPKLILSETALCNDQLNVGDLLIHNTGRNYPENHNRAFAEDLAWRVAVDNNLLGDLANSFLVLARTSEPPARIGWLAKAYSKGHRRPTYQVEVSIAAGEVSGFNVQKRQIFPKARVDGRWFRQVIQSCGYVSGNLLVAKIHTAMARDACHDELADCFEPWITFLKSHVSKSDKNGLVLPNDFVDCIPANVIETVSGEVKYFDAEWIGNDAPPLAWIVIRGVVNSLVDCLENKSLFGITYRQFISYIANKNGISLSGNDFLTAEICETRLTNQTQLGMQNKPWLANVIDKPIGLTARLANGDPNYQRSLSWHQTELARIKKSVSWRVTAPFRVFYNFLSAPFQKRNVI